jgi:hypothetical protein
VIRRALTLPVDRLASDVPEAERTYVIALDDRVALLVARVTDLYPLTREDYDRVMANPRSIVVLGGEGTATAALDALSFEALKTRHQFSPIRDSSTEDPTETAAAGDAPAAPKQPAS